MNRNLDGAYFRVLRDGKWQSICFSDLTEDEMNEVLKNRNEEWLKSLCIHLGRALRDVGDKMHVVREDEEE